MKAIRLPYRNGKVADDYFVELMGYITFEKFRRRVAIINDVIIQHGVSRGLLMFPVLLVWLTIVIVIPISIKRQTEPQPAGDKNSFNPLVIAMLVIIFSVVAACAAIVSMVTKANHRKLVALNELLVVFNAEDNQVYVNWRIANDSGCQFDKNTVRCITSAEKCLIIEIGVIRPMLELAPGDRATYQSLHDATPHAPQSPPPPYEVAFKDPPPALTPTWRTPRGSVTIPPDLSRTDGGTDPSLPQQIT